MNPAEAPTPVAPPRRRPRLALSLRMLMVLVLVAGSWLAWKANRARDQRRAVAAILKTGGEVLYDWQEPGSNHTPKPGAAIPAPGFLRRLVGDEFFQDVVHVVPGGRGPIPAETLEAIALLPNVRSLNLSMMRIDPDAMAKISGMTSLRVLSLGMTRVTDEALAQLAGLANLEELYLHWSDVRDGTRHLVGMSRLRVISLSHARLGDAGLAHLAKLPGLKELSLHDNPVSDPAVRRFMADRPDVAVEYAFPNPPHPTEIEPRPL